MHPTTNLDAPNSNLQNIKHKHVDQPAKTHVTPYRFHLMGNKSFSNMYVACKMFCAMLQGELCNFKCWFCGPDKGVFRLCTHTYVHRICITEYYIKKGKVNPLQAQRVGRDIALLFHYCGTRRGWVVSSTPRPHFTPGKDPVPILQEVGWAQDRSGRAENLVPTGIRSRNHQP